MCCFTSQPSPRVGVDLSALEWLTRTDFDTGDQLNVHVSSRAAPFFVALARAVQRFLVEQKDRLFRPTAKRLVIAVALDFLDESRAF